MISWIIFLQELKYVLILYTDGLTEASVNEIEYGEGRLKKQLLKSGTRSAQNIINELIVDHKRFLKDSPRFGDATIAILKKIQN